MKVLSILLSISSPSYIITIMLAVVGAIILGFLIPYLKRKGKAINVIEPILFVFVLAGILIISLFITKFASGSFLYCFAITAGSCILGIIIRKSKTNKQEMRERYGRR